MILDADLTVPAPKIYPSFYEAIVSGKGEFINGTRLVYPMERQAMRFFEHSWKQNSSVEHLPIS